MDLDKIVKLVEACQNKARVIEIEKDKIKIVFAGGMVSDRRPQKTEMLPTKTQTIKRLVTDDEATDIEEELMLADPLAYEEKLFKEYEPKSELEKQKIAEQVFEGETYL